MENTGNRADVPDIICDGLDVIFVGYNPGVKSGATGHHFAGPGNLFWALLYDSGLTTHRLTPERDGELLYWGIGITNLVARATPGAHDLTLEEQQMGVTPLVAKLQKWRPRVVGFLGKDVYRIYRDLPKTYGVEWGIQASPRLEQLWECVLPNPSRRSTIAYGVRLRYFAQVRGLIENRVKPGDVGTGA